MCIQPRLYFFYLCSLLSNTVQIVEHARRTLQNSACCELVSSELQWCDKDHSTNKTSKKAHQKHTYDKTVSYATVYVNSTKSQST